MENLAVKKCLILFMILASMFKIQAKGFSQGQNVSLEYDQVKLGVLLTEIEEVTNKTFLYNVKDINLNETVSLHHKDSPLDQALNAIFADLSLDYKMEEDQIVLFPAEKTVTKKEEKAMVKHTPNVEADQQREITGTVTDAEGVPLPGVNITVEGTSRGTQTDFDGNYAINAGKGEALVFSFVGFKSQTIAVNNEQTIDLVMQETEAILDEVVIVGYGTIQKRNLTGAVSSVKPEDIKVTGSNNVSKGLQGRIPGVQIESAGGNPGSGTRVLIRGVGTWNNNSPLYIVDGVQVSDINNINPIDIESLDVLKDASAASIYGSRAANGVVLVTTKTGRKGKTNIYADAYFGLQRIGKKLNVLDGREWAQMSNAAHEAAGQSGLTIAANPEQAGQGVNWQNEIFHAAPVQSYQLGMDGGGENGSYSVTMGYFNQDGIVKNTEYNRLNLRTKSKTKIGRLTLGETVILSQEKNDLLPGGGGQGGSVVGSALKSIPLFDIYDDNAIGGFGGPRGSVVDVWNPVALLNLNKVRNEETRLLVNAFAQVDLFEGLNYKLNLGYTNTFGHDFNYEKRYEVGDKFSHATNDLSENDLREKFIMLENTLNYNKEFGDHNIQALAGYAVQKNRISTSMGSVKDLPDGITILNAGEGSRSSGGDFFRSGLISYFGRLIYSYSDRYVLTGSIRRDGSSRFASRHRFGNFPSIALGWNISNEDFFDGLNSTISELKLRTSYGILGNQEFDDYAYLASIQSNRNYITGVNQDIWSGANQNSLIDPNIKWESTKTFDVGIDASLFEYKLDVSADFYTKRTSDILLDLPLPGSVGSTDNPITNAGKISNVGFELGLNYSGGDSDGLKYNVMAAFSTEKNRVKKLINDQPIFGGQPTHHGASTTTTQVGGPVGAFYLVQTDGIFNSEEEVQQHVNSEGKLIQPNAKPGDIRFVDENDDGIISDKDKVYRGSPFPKFSYSFGFNGAWKNFDFSAFFQGTYGNKIYNGLAMDLEGMNLNYNWAKSTLNAWTPDNQTNMPRAVINDPNENTRVSDRFLENGSYLRLKNLQVGYSFKKSVVDPIGLNSLRLYFSADNLFTITNYSGYNPDLGREGSVLDRGVDFGHVEYPLARTFSIGLQINMK